MRVQLSSVHPNFAAGATGRAILLAHNQKFYGAVAERRMHFTVDEDDDGSSPFGPANFMRRRDRKGVVLSDLNNHYQEINYVCTKEYLREVSP